MGWLERTEVRPRTVDRARDEAMAEFRKHVVYMHVPLQDCITETGRTPIECLWVDVNKGDEDYLESRSRLVAT